MTAVCSESAGQKRQMYPDLKGDAQVKVAFEGLDCDSHCWGAAGQKRQMWPMQC